MPDVSMSETDRTAMQAADIARIVGAFYCGIKDQGADEDTARQLSILWTRKILNGRA